MRPCGWNFYKSKGRTGDSFNELLGFLCVDNISGGFENETCIRYLQYLHGDFL